MAFEEGLDEVVSIITSYFLDGGKDLAEHYGDQAPALAGEIAQMLEELFQGDDTPYSALWKEYKQEPVANEAELIGVLEVLEEAMPEVTIRLEGYYAAFQALDQPGVQTLVETPEPEDTIQIEELEGIKSNDDMDDDDEYREDNTYLVGNVEDRSTSAMYIEGLDTNVEPNQSEDDDTSLGEA